MKTYRTTTSDENVFHVFDACNDFEAEEKALGYCRRERLTLWNIEELDEDYNVIRSVF